MIEIKQASQRLNDAIRVAENLALAYCHEYLLPEHLLLAISQQPEFLRATDFDVESILVPFLEETVESIKEELESSGELEDFEPEPSIQFVQAINIAYQQMYYSSVDEITVPHVINAMKELESSLAANVVAELMKQDDGEFLSNIIGTYGADDEEESYESIPFGDELDNTPSKKQQQEEWRQYVTCLNDLVESHNPLIGREKELERTIQILCRKDKNNPLHIGEPGVGKTALAYGLAAMIEERRVPEKLQDCKIYEMDLGGIIAGTAYRGEFEKRLKAVLEGVKAQGNLRFTDSEQSRARISEPQGQSQNQSPSILYIDEIHNIIGAGKIDKGSLDASNILKPYLEQGTLRFMGSTTYEEYNQNFIRSKGFARRFERVDIAEPTVDECVQILQGLKAKYEEYHGVTFTDEAIRYAAEGADRYITGRFLPDKAIDLLDEAGSYAQISGKTESSGISGNSGLSGGTGSTTLTIDKAQIKVVLAKICRVDTLAEDADDISKLETLEARISSQIYGQQEAVKEVTEAIQMASAGLIDDNKPMASLLFVGPTGVGKTEVAKILAKELSLPIIRFDMSEYAEKHAVAKLIGSPAGYVGYDDGGLLTDAVRKQPHCVLLLDELEKAHQDIYDILLQVMDYAVLTDNKGQKADFRHVILLMTTNAGAQYARQAGMGFVKNLSAGEAMMKKVKSTFKPEFLNRLTGVTIFHDMNRQMAELILQKKLKHLEQQLATKNVTLELSAAAREHLLNNGFSEEYGGREVDRVITNELKPILMRAILFGSLKNGGVAKVDVAEGKLAIGRCVASTHQ